MYKKMMQHQIFFDFLQFCIDSESEIPYSLIEADWNELCRIAQKQALVGSKPLAILVLYILRISCRNLQNSTRFSEIFKEI